MSGTFIGSKGVGRNDHSPSPNAEVELVQLYHYRHICCDVVHKKKFTFYMSLYKVTS